MHRALGRPGRAGRVDQNGEVVGAATCKHFVPQRLAALHVVAPQRHELRKRHHHRIGKAAQALHVEHHDALQGGATRPAGQDLVELLLVFREQHPGSGIPDEIFHLWRRIGRIDAGRDAAGAENADVGEHPFRHGIGHDGSDIARSEADRVQRIGDLPRNLQPLAPADRLPDAEFLLADRGTIAARLHRERKAVCDRVGDRQHCRSGHARFLLCPGPASACRLHGRS